MKRNPTMMTTAALRYIEGRSEDPLLSEVVTYLYGPPPEEASIALIHCMGTNTNKILSRARLRYGDSSRWRTYKDAKGDTRVRREPGVEIP